jgi:hypothetical protein
MNTRDLTTILPLLMSELVNGAGSSSYMTNRGDPGLLASLDRLSAAEASVVPTGGASIAAHVDHLRYGMALMNAWSPGQPDPFTGADETLSWKNNIVSNADWRKLCADLRREVTAFLETLRTPREMSEVELAWVISTIPHLAYHFGAIRQINRHARGPSAEEARQFKDPAR